MWDIPKDTQTDAIQNLMKQMYEHQWISLTKSYQIMINILQEMMKLQEKMMKAVNPTMPDIHSFPIPHPTPSHPVANPQEILAKNFSLYTTLMEQWKHFLPKALAMKNPWQEWSIPTPSSEPSS